MFRFMSVHDNVAVAGGISCGFCVKIVAVIASVVPFLVTLGLGAAAAGVPELGERLVGLFLAIGALVAFAATLSLVFAPLSFFRGGRSVLAVLGAIVGALPLAVLAWATLVFAHSPFGGNASILDWGGTGFGTLLIIGVLAILVLGYWRVTETARPKAEEGRQPLAERPLVTAMSPPPSYGRDDDVRVTRV